MSEKNVRQIKLFHSWVLLPCYLSSKLNSMCTFFIAKATFHLSLGLAQFGPFLLVLSDFFSKHY
jgi:hypothetical protein